MGLFNDIDPIFFYHKSIKPLLAMGFNGVVTPSAFFREAISAHSCDLARPELIPLFQT
jgi:hypothetical protein